MVDCKARATNAVRPAFPFLMIAHILDVMRDCSCSRNSSRRQVPGVEICFVNTDQFLHNSLIKL
jgi:hypothetical protein